ncbi:hypothetical protein IKE82_00495 [Candidatus Saccharibacteria bacterium]|nr:hypothetical protein [Candidatus Saccharibacteria bacterium]
MDDDANNNSKMGDLARDIKDSWKRDWQPDFQRSVTGKEKPKQQSRQTEGAQKELGAAESTAASGGLYRGGKASVKEGEEQPGFEYTGKGKSIEKKAKSKFSVAKMSAGVVVGLIVALVAVVVMVLGTPIFQIGNWDFNLMDSLGFLNRIGILDKVATFVLGENLEEGTVPDKLAGKMAEQGLMVGQVAANGDFVRTNVYIANADELKDLAVLGNYQVSPSEGQLAVLFDGEVTEAEDLIAKLESDPKMYMAFLDATDIGAAYWYSGSMEKQLKELGVGSLRSAFSDWQSTGDKEKDTEEFEEQMAKLLDSDSELALSGILETVSSGGEKSSSSLTAAISGSDDANGVISDVADKMEDTTQGGANAKMTQSLNAVLSAGEPYIAAKYFMLSESIMQRARITGEGPINEFMNEAYMDKEVSYTDAFSTDTVETNGSILSSGVMVATIGGGSFPKSEAASLSRDRGIITMDSAGVEVSKSGISSTVISTEGEKKSDVLTAIASGEKANKDKMEVLSDAVDKVVVQKNSDLFAGVVGGTRIPEGGEFILNMVDSHLLGALPSSDEKVAKYHREAEEMVARRAEAERATKSPFDISSPYTFMGSLVRSLATTVMKSRASNNDGAGSMVSIVANITSDSTKGIYDMAFADGDDGSYELATGDYCETPSVVGASSSVLCGAKYTLSTEYMDVTMDEFEEELKAKKDMDEDGEIDDESELGKFIAVGMGRYSTVGIKDAEVCKRYKELEGDFWRDFLDALAGLVGQYQACDGREEVGTGEKYTLNGNNSEDLEYYAAFVMRDQVESLLSGEESRVTAFKEKYYTEHPLDNSREGKIARVSGLTKNEVKMALAYADYLTFIAKYNPTERYAFGSVLDYEESERPLVEHAGQVAVELYAMWHGHTEYDDLRGRIRVG